jgi:hypothetical protein
MNFKSDFFNYVTWSFLFQIIRNFIVEYNYEMKFESKFIHIPKTPLKFKMIDRVWVNSPVGLSSSTITGMENSILYIKIICGKER